jgi:SH3-like domain-containing protein
MAQILFPLRKRPAYSYKDGGREFGACRSGCSRLHAGCDLLAPKGTEVLAIDNGTVIQGPYHFYDVVYALEVKHDSGIVVRYGEILQSLPRGISPGARVSRGQVIGYVGLMTSGSSMLHFEMYRGTVNGELTTGSGPYRRRSDLMDPTPFLDAALFGPVTPPKPLQPGEARANDHVSTVLNLRSQPAVEASIVTTLSPGTVAKLVRSVTGGPYTAEGSSRNDWFELETGGQAGFAAGYYVEVGKDSGQQGGQTRALGTGRVNNHVTSTLNLRSEANSHSVVVASLSPGMAVTVMAKVAGEAYSVAGASRTDWYQLQCGDDKGFAAAFYVDLDDPNSTQPTTKARGTVNSSVSSSLNVRERPELQAPILFTLASAETFEILDSVTGDTYAGGRNDWQHIRHSQGTGYAVGFYISVNQQDTPKSRWDKVLPNVPTMGASAATASQDGLPPGIAASEAMAQRDLPRIKPLTNALLVAAGRFGVPAALLAALASRESGAGAALDGNGWGDHGNGFGILQVDKNAHTILGSESPTSQAHIEQATGILAANIDAVQAAHPDWDDVYILKGAVAAYNFGASNVKTINGMDIGTTGGDYSSDVIARAKYYLRHADLPMFRQ